MIINGHEAGRRRKRKMSDYKLVPIGPTPEMIEAGARHVTIIDSAAESAEKVYRAMWAAAPQPAEQSACPVCHGEGLNPLTEVPMPCANCHGERQPEYGCCGQTDRCDDDCDAVVIGGHRAAEQQPAAGDLLTSIPDEVFAAEFAEWWDEHGQFCRAGGGTYERTFAFEAWRHLYPQLMNMQMAAAERQVIPNEHGKNRYGLDMSYFRQLFNRELNRPLVDYRPSELARVLARASRTADPKVMHEAEFRIAEHKPVCPDCAGSGNAEHSITVQESDSAAPGVALLVDALESLLDMQDEDCRYDHQGYCQNHNLDHVDDGCRVARAKTALAAHRKQQEQSND